jgi:hypothetical protein
MTEGEAGTQYPVVGWTAGVDWLTQVYEVPEQADRAEWRAEQWIADERERGNRVLRFGLGGFAGQSAGGISVGRRGSSVLVQATSDRAQWAYSALRAIGGHPSRVDLHLTALTASRAFVPPVDAYNDAPASRGRGRRTESRTLIQNKAGGLTCYVGSPKSEMRMRIYDKGAESGDTPPGEKWRWEIQLRRQRASQYATALGPATPEEAAVAALVLAHCQRVGVRRPELGSVLPNPPAAPQSTDAADSLEWLRKGVSPAVQRLLLFYPRATVMAALGLDDGVTAPFGASH